MKIVQPTGLDARRTRALNRAIFSTFDFVGALLFVVGSALFFREATVSLGNWAFLLGSASFGVRPMITLIREVSVLRRYRARKH